MATDPRLRASDDDRERTAELIRRNFAEGRLDADEVDDRLGRAYDARTVGDLAALTADLPVVDPYGLPVPVGGLPPYRRRPAGPPARAGNWPAVAASWVSVSVICILIWVLTGHAFFWPVFPIAIGAIVMLRTVIAGRGDD